MATKASEINKALREAAEPEAIVAALARAEYRKAHPGRDCPQAFVPPVEEFAALALREILEPAAALKPHVPPKALTEFSTNLVACILAVDDRSEALQAMRRERRALWTGVIAHWRRTDADAGEPTAEEAEAAAGEARRARNAHLLTHHRLWQEAIAKEPIGHPFAGYMREWLARPPEIEPWRPVERATLPRFDRSTVEEARLLAHTDAAKPAGPFQGELLHTDDVVDSCPAWLLDMFWRAKCVRKGRDLGSTRGGMPWSFTLVIGGLAHFSIAGRRVWAPGGRDLVFRADEARAGQPQGIDEIIGWIHPQGWANRSRDWHRLNAAFEEITSYRVTAGDGLRYWIVSAYGLPAVYKPGAPVTLTVRVPPSAAYGARFDWRRYLGYAKRATMQRALLATAGHLDKTAVRGHPLTRWVREPVLDKDGKPKRERIIGRDGEPKRDKAGRYRMRIVYTGRLVPNPLLGWITPAVLPDRNVAKFLGLENTGSNRHAGKAALDTLQADGVIDLERVRNGYRIFGPSPKAGTGR